MIQAIVWKVNKMSIFFGMMKFSEPFGYEFEGENLSSVFLSSLEDFSECAFAYLM